MKGVEVQRHEKESALYQDQLQHYIHNYLQQGYSPDELEHHLISRGYEEESVRKALKQVNEKFYQSKLAIHTTKTPVNKIIFAGILLVVLIMIIYFFSQFGGSYEFFISLQNPDITTNEPLSFLVSTTKEVNVNIQVTTTQGNFVLEKNDVFDGSTTYYVWLPNDIRAGTYTIDFFVTYKGEETQHSFSFAVTSAQTKPVSQIDIQQLTLALNERDSELCEYISSLPYRDECYSTLALYQLDDRLCSLVATPSAKDDCYFTQVLNGNRISCGLIEDVVVQDACYGLNR